MSLWPLPGPPERNATFVCNTNPLTAKYVSACCALFWLLFRANKVCLVFSPYIRCFIHLPQFLLYVEWFGVFKSALT